MDEERTTPYTTSELADLAGVTDRHVRELVRTGKLAGSKIGHFWVVPADIGQAWLNEREEKERAERARWEKY